MPAFSFSIDTDAGPLTEAHYAASPIVARVFNADFIAENLNFAGSSFKPILLLGADSEKAQKEIDDLEAQAKATRATSEKRSKAVTTNKKAMDAAKTTSAAAVETTIGIVEAFGATQLERQISLARMELAKFKLAETVVQEKLKLAHAKEEDKLPALTSVSLTTKLDGILVEVPVLLSKIPDLAHTIEHLAQHPDIEGWISTGLALHDGKTDCEFCGGPLKIDRLATLAAHFSQDLMNHMQALSNLKIKLAGTELAYAAPKDAEVEPAYRAKLGTAIGTLQAAIVAYNQALNTAIRDLDKKSQSPFQSIAQTPIPLGLTKAVIDAVKVVNAVIELNNGAFKNFSSDKADAINELKLHFAQAFCVEKKIDGYELRQKRLASFDGNFVRSAITFELRSKRLPRFVPRR